MDGFIAKIRRFECLDTEPVGTPDGRLRACEVALPRRACSSNAPLTAGPIQVARGLRAGAGSARVTATADPLKPLRSSRATPPPRWHRPATSHAPPAGRCG